MKKESDPDSVSLLRAQKLSRSHINDSFSRALIGCVFACAAPPAITFILLFVDAIIRVFIHNWSSFVPFHIFQLIMVCVLTPLLSLFVLFPVVFLLNFLKITNIIFFILSGALIIAIVAAAPSLDMLKKPAGWFLILCSLGMAITAWWFSNQKYRPDLTHIGRNKRNT